MRTGSCANACTAKCVATTSKTQCTRYFRNFTTAAQAKPHTVSEARRCMFAARVGKDLLGQQQPNQEGPLCDAHGNVRSRFSPLPRWHSSLECSRGRALHPRTTSVISKLTARTSPFTFGTFPQKV